MSRLGAELHGQLIVHARDEEDVGPRGVVGALVRQGNGLHAVGVIYRWAVAEYGAHIEGELGEDRRLYGRRVKAPEPEELLCACTRVGEERINRPSLVS